MQTGRVVPLCVGDIGKYYVHRCVEYEYDQISFREIRVFRGS
jgi:hypothetical protein